MLVLGIETATPTCAVALWQDGRLLAESRIKAKNLHGEIISGLIEQLFKQARRQFDDLSGVAVSRGPGSFTGLRIGMAVGKAIAFARSLPMVGIHTLDGIAGNIAPLTERLVVTLPSRKGEVFAAPYRHLDGEYQREGEIVALTIEAFQEWASGVRTIAGPGIKSLQDAGVTQKYYLPEHYWEVGAASIARLGARRILAGEIDDLARLEPDYVKPFFTTAVPKTDFEST